MVQQQHPGRHARRVAVQRELLPQRLFQRRLQHCRDGRPRRLRRQHEVERQRDTPALLYRQHLVPAVGIEGEPAEVLCLQVLRRQGGFLLPQLHPQRPANVRRRPDQHQRGDHAGVFLGVLVRLEELAGAVDQQVVQPGVELFHAECLGDRLLQRGEGAGLPVEAEQVGADLAGVAHGGVQQGLVAQAELRGFAEVVQRLGLGGRQRLGQRAESFDLDGQVLGGQAAFRPEAVRGGGAVWRGGSRCGRLAQEVEQGVHGQSLWQHRPETVHRTASRPQIEPHRLRAGQWV